MEQVLPGADPDDPFSDPITESNDCKDGGHAEGAFRVLMDLCQADLRCLDAHAHLGNLAFDAWPKIAVRHYEVGFRIGECRFYVACMDSGCASGVWKGSRRPRVFSIGWSG